MMKRFTRPAAALLAALLLLSLCACSKSPAISITAAEAKLSGLNSMSYNMDTTMTMSYGGQSMGITATIQADYVAKPLVVRMQVSAATDTDGTDNTQNMQMYVVQDGSAYTAYTSADDGATWTSQTLPDASQAAQYDVKSSLGLYIDSAKTFTENGTEQVNGSNATRFDGEIPADALSQVLTASGMSQQFDALGLGDIGSDLFSGMDSMPISIWVDQQSGYPVRYQMDMTSMMSALINNLMSQAGSAAAADSFSFDNVIVNVTMSNFNTIGKLEVPAAALNS